MILTWKRPFALHGLDRIIQRFKGQGDRLVDSAAAMGGGGVGVLSCRVAEVPTYLTIISY